MCRFRLWTFVGCFGLCFVFDSIALGAEAELQRVDKALAFASKLFGRELTIESVAEFYVGREPFDKLEVADAKPAERYNIRHVVALRSDQKVFLLNESEWWDEKPDPELIKVMYANGRHCNINYEGQDTDTPINSMTEQQNSAVQSHRTYDFSLLWGFFANDYLPSATEWLSKASWAASEDGNRIVGVYDGFTLSFVFDRDDPTTLTRIEVTPQNDRKAVFTSQVFELLEWESSNDLLYPSKYRFWCLMKLDSGWQTEVTSSTVSAIGPKREISDRYGDFFTDVPDDTLVQVNDYMGIDFIWKDGEIVREVDHAKLSSLIDRPFFASPMRRYVLANVGFLMLGIIAIVVWRRSGRKWLTTTSEVARDGHSDT